jgi:hypothetical protein
VLGALVVIEHHRIEESLVTCTDVLSCHQLQGYSEYRKVGGVGSDLSTRNNEVKTKAGTAHSSATPRGLSV